MSDGLVCLLAVLVIVCVFSPDAIVSQCTTKSCDNGDNEANVMTLVSRMQQQLAEQTETIISMKQDVAQLEEERIRDHRSMEQLQQELAEQRETTGRIQREITSLTETQNASCSKSCQSAAQDCTDLLREGNTRSGVYYIHVPGTETATPVYCDMETDGGGWLVFQRRHDASIDFYRDWSAYKRGFGDFSNNFWLGNEYIHALTSDRQYELRVDLEDFEDESRYAAYSTFAVSSEADKYKFILGTYNGTAGDSLRHHANTGFSTKDRDNDRTNTTHCALTLKGGWWYGSCTGTNMNGVYHKGSKSMETGIYWQLWQGHNTLKKVEMKIRS